VTARRNRWLSAALSRVETGASPSGFALKAWLLFSASVTGFLENNDLLRASALTYTTALSIVPVLALAFSVLKGFGSSERMRPLVENYLALGGSGAGRQLMHYVENVNAAALGSAGGAFLLITVISTMGNVEQAFNAIFRVPRSRSYLRKFSDYLSVLFTVPILITAALAITTVISMRIGSVPGGARAIPYLFAWAGFFFLFVFFPYTQVRWGPAALGSAVTALLFQLAQWGYVHFQIGMANYRAIYGALATVPIFLVWIYVAWSVVLFGAEITAAAQRGVEQPALRPHTHDFPCAAAIHILLQLADRQLRGDGALTRVAIARQLGIAESQLEPVFDQLQEQGLLIETAAERDSAKAGIYLVRAPSAIVLADALAPFLGDDSGPHADLRAARVMRRIAEAESAALASMTLADLLNEEADTATAPAAVRRRARPTADPAK
jgi:membrane protein